MDSSRLSPILESEALINCWIREGGPTVAMRRDWLRIPLTSPQAECEFLEVFFSSRTLLGDVRLNRLVQCGATPGAELSPARLADVLVAEIQTLYAGKCSPHAPPDWKENLEGSIQVMDAIFARQETSRIDESLDFIRSEQSLAHGHRFHPSPKSRIGFSAEELPRYSPEWGARFPLHYVAIRNGLARIRGDFPAWSRIAATILPADLRRSHCLLPLHPWQARRLIGTPEFAKLVEDGAAADLGIQGPEFFATSSVRTLYQPEFDLFVKTSLDVRITNCFRRNLPQEMDAIQAFRRILQELKPGGSNLRVMDEPMSVDFAVKVPFACGAILREGLAAERSEGLEPLLTGALFGERDLGSRRLSRLIKPGAETSWFRAYCEGLVPPVLDAFFRHGIMFEPHLQNVLVCLREGLPVRFVLRDLDNAKLVLGYPAAKILPADPALAQEMTYPEDYAWRRLVYCLFVNHLSECVAALARTSETGQAQEREAALWQVLREVLLQSCPKHPRIDELLTQPALWAKKNFFTRITRTPDKDAPMAEIPNPLSKTS